MTSSEEKVAGPAYWKRRVWLAVVALALVSILMEFSYVWRQLPFIPDIGNRLDLLQKGYSFSRTDDFHQDKFLTTEAEVTEPERKSKCKADPEANEQSNSNLTGQEAQDRLDKEVTGEEHLRFIHQLEVKEHDKWIVLDATSGNCRKELPVPAGWTMLMIRRPDQPVECVSPSCICLLSKLNITQAEVTSRMMWRNLAYLTAISHNASLILDAHCSVSPSIAVEVLQERSHKDHGLLYNESLLFNPYAHFGAWATVPLAVGRSKLQPNSRLYYVRDFDKVQLKQGLSEASADVLVSSDVASASEASTYLGTRFDPSAPPVFLGHQSFSPAVPICSLYRPSAFWGLFLPCLSHSVRCLVLRQYIVHRLLREVDAHSGFYQLRAQSVQAGLPGQQGTASDVSAGLDAEKLASVLNAWKCKSHLTFSDCLNALVSDLCASGFLHPQENLLVKSWIVALRKIKFLEPERVTSPWRGVRKTSEVRVTMGNVKSRLETGDGNEEQCLRNLTVGVVRDRCNDSVGVNWFPVAQWKKPLFHDIVLIVVFNTNAFFWNNFPVLETLHRPYFRHIVYCVPNVDELLTGSGREKLRHVTLVEALSVHWYLMYECATIVARMNIQGVRGYLQIGDDTLLNTWMLFNSSRDSIWMPEGFITVKADKAHGWYWWMEPWGSPALLRALADLESISGLSSQEILKLDPNFNKTKVSKPRVMTFSEIFVLRNASIFSRLPPRLAGSEVWEKPSRKDAVKFLQNYYGANRLTGLVKHKALDFFYIPQVHVETFVKFSRYFMSYRVLIELALPAIQFGLAQTSDVTYLRASSLWGGDRNSPQSHYDNSSFYLHPFKLKANMQQKLSRDFFCKVYLRTLFSELFKHITTDIHSTTLTSTS